MSRTHFIQKKTYFLLGLNQKKARLYEKTLKFILLIYKVGLLKGQAQISFSVDCIISCHFSTHIMIVSHGKDENIVCLCKGYVQSRAQDVGILLLGIVYSQTGALVTRCNIEESFAYAQASPYITSSN